MAEPHEALLGSGEPTEPKPGSSRVRTFHEYMSKYQPNRYAALRQKAEYLHAEHHEGVIVPSLESCGEPGHTERHYIDIVMALEDAHVIPRT